MLSCIKWIMLVWATVYPYRLHLKISTLLDIMYTYWVSPNFNAVGKKCRIRRGLKLYGNAKEIAKDKQVSRIHVSITNTREFAQAFAIGECV